jgi:UDP-N-acetylmuramoyl-tripeptide--D-alanyl-D-alanine ligase
MIDDSYNASPASMASALDVLNSLPCEGRRIAVLGEMGELGRESRRLHGYVGAYVAAVAPDLVVWIGEQEATEMHEAALVMGLSEDRMELFSDVTSALRVIGPILEPSDLVLVKASRSAGLDAFVRGVLA